MPELTVAEWAGRLHKMEKLEIYNIGEPGRAVYGYARKRNWRARLLDRLLRRGLIAINPLPSDKTFILTPLGEQVRPLIENDALNLVAEFRARNQAFDNPQEHGKPVK